MGRGQYKGWGAATGFLHTTASLRINPVCAALSPYNSQQNLALLAGTRLGVDEVAAQVGYADGATLRALLRRRLNLGVRELSR